jgi:hypothetical protein
MKIKNQDTLEDVWDNSRAGARAGRGFHYQHLVVVHVLLLQWAKKIRLGSIVPEGLEDFTLESEEIELWVQIKSKRDGLFSQNQADKYLQIVKEKSNSTLKKLKPIKELLILEQSCSNFDEKFVDDIFDSEHTIFVSKVPENDSVKLLVEQLDVAEIVANGIVSDLYMLVADCSQKNAKLDYAKRQKISSNDVEGIINIVLSYSDFSLIDKAILNRSIKLIQFEISEPNDNFYKGVKARPKHISSGLALFQNSIIKEVTSNLASKNKCLICGPSGAGKSALLWTTVFESFDQYRWFELSSTTTVQDINSIFEFISSRSPSRKYPIAIAFDEINSQNYEVWNLCFQHFLDIDDLYFIGSIRAEDKYLINNSGEIYTRELSLDSETAEFIWKNLSKTKNTDWQHWQEPYNNSKKLMLEYIHILTQGNRLSELVSDQIKARENHERYHELAIIRVCSEISAFGGEIDAVKLQKALNISPQEISLALKRLLDEHLVHENRKGVLGGLHDIRSNALSAACHDGIIFNKHDSLIVGLKCATYETLPYIVYSTFKNIQPKAQEQLINELAKLLSDNDESYFWVGILKGLGLVTLEHSVNLLINKLEKYQVRRSIWNTVSMFAITDAEPPKIGGNTHWQSVIDCLEEYKSESHIDYRLLCLALLDENTKRPKLRNLEDSTEFLACIIPFYKDSVFPTNFDIDVVKTSDYDGNKISDLADFLLSAYQINPDFSQNIVEKLGGTDALLNIYHSQSSWLTKPKLISNGKHGVTVGSNIHFIADDDVQADFNTLAVDNCEVLLALSPQAKAAECRIVWPNGESFKVGEHSYHDKNMPRANIHAKDKVVWNVAFQKIMNSKASIERSTDYTIAIQDCINKSEKLFRAFSEQWIKGKSTNQKNLLAEKFNEIINTVNELNYSEEETGSQQFNKQNKTPEIDRLTGVISGLLSNLSTRMGKVVPGEKCKSEAVYAGDLAQDFLAQRTLKIWSFISSPPIEQLTKLSKRIEDVSYILHEMDHDPSPNKIASIIKVAKKGTLGGGIAAAARFSRDCADKKLRKLLNSLKNELALKEHYIDFELKKIESKDSIYWPPVEISILIKMENVLEEAGHIDIVLESAKNILGQDWLYSLTPLVKGVVVSSMSVKPAFNMPLPYPNSEFTKNWKHDSKHTFFESDYQNYFLLCLSSIQSLSLIVAVRDLSELTEGEGETVDKLKHCFKSNLELIEKFIEDNDLIDLDEISDFIHERWNEMVDESTAFSEGKEIKEPVYTAAKSYVEGHVNEELQLQGVYGLALLQSELDLR